MPDRPHLSDAELVRCLDGEPDRAGAARHLAECGLCRARQRQLADAARAYLAIHPAPVATARSWKLPALAAAAMLAVSLAAWRFLQPLPGAGLPDSRLTPGAVQFTNAAQVCALETEADQTPVASELALAVFRDYRIPHPPAGAYEVDYLISPALGGSRQAANLWPQPYATGEWNSRVKDALEDHLRAQVCQGKLELADAQREIAANWIAAYRRHFRTQRPLAQHALFVKDRSWP